MDAYLLVVESDRDLQRRIAEALRDAPYEVAAETEVSWAKRSIAVRPPSIVILDTQLTDGPGFSLADELRRDADTRDTPILFVATKRFRGAHHRSEILRRYAPAAYLRAPDEMGELRHRLDAAISRGIPTQVQDISPTEPNMFIPDLPLPSRTRTPSGIILPDPEQRREKRDVERTAKSLEGAESDLRGALKRTPFARLLQRLFAQRATGSLLMMKEDTKKIVSFSEGYPVSVKSNVLSECLGQILLQQRLISHEALQESVRRMKAEKRHQGELLVEMGVLSPYNLSRALMEQVEAKLFNIFAWPDGQFMFKEGEPPPAEALRLDRSPAAIILEGIRRHYDAARQSAVLIPYAGKYVKLNPDPMMRLQALTSDPTEQEFVRGIDGRTRLETVVSSARISKEQARLLLVALAQAGMIEPADAPAVRPNTPIASSAVAVDLTGGPASVPDTAEPLSTPQLALVAQTVKNQDHYWALGVQQDASIQEVDRAYEALARSFHPDRYRHHSDEDRHLAQDIFDRLTEAHRVLRDPTKRRAYSAKLEKPRASSDPSSGPIPVGAAKELYDAGMEHLRANRHREAVEAFRQAARMLPNQAEFRAGLGWALFREAPADARAGRAALAELRRAIQLDPKNRRARYYLGHFHAQTGQSAQAIAEFEKLLELDPGAVDVVDELRRLRESR